MGKMPRIRVPQTKPGAKRGARGNRNAGSSLKTPLTEAQADKMTTAGPSTPWTTRGGRPKGTGRK